MAKKVNKKIGKKLVFILDLKPYNQQAIIVCNGQFSDAIATFRKYSKGNKRAANITKYVEENLHLYPDDYIHNSGNAKLYTGLPNGYVMLISHCDSWKETVGNVVHESAHLTHYILRRAGLQLIEESEEAYTYLLGDIVERILTEIY